MFLPPRLTEVDEITHFALASKILEATASALNPAKMALCMAPMRVHASMVYIASGMLGIYSTTISVVND